jgi:hypothetical protein
MYNVQQPYMFGNLSLTGSFPYVNTGINWTGRIYNDNVQDTTQVLNIVNIVTDNIPICEVIDDYGTGMYEPFGLSIYGNQVCGLEDFTYQSGYGIGIGIGSGVGGSYGINLNSCWFYPAWLKVNNNFPTNDTQFGLSMRRSVSEGGVYPSMDILDGTQADANHYKFMILDDGTNIQFVYLDNTNNLISYEYFTCSQAIADTTWLNVNGTIRLLPDNTQQFDINVTDDYGMICNLTKVVNETWLMTSSTIGLGTNSGCEYGNVVRTFDNVFMYDIERPSEVIPPIEDNDITGQVTNQTVEGVTSVFVIIIVIAVVLALAIGFAGYIGLVESKFMLTAIGIILIGAVLLLVGIAFKMFVLV